MYLYTCRSLQGPTGIYTCMHTHIYIRTYTYTHVYDRRPMQQSPLRFGPRGPREMAKRKTRVVVVSVVEEEEASAAKPFLECLRETHRETYTHRHTHTHTLSLSLSLSLKVRDRQGETHIDMVSKNQERSRGGGIIV
jgi:hypothetical protein